MQKTAEAAASFFCAMSTRKCPKCGGVMYIREGKYGKFLGCSRYPRCKGTLKLYKLK